MFSVILTWSFVILCVKFSINVEPSSSITVETVEGGQAKREVELETTIAIQKVKNMTLNKRSNAAPLKPQQYLKFIEISETFRKAISREGGYWNRKQHNLFLELDSMVRPEGNESEWKEPDERLCNGTSSEVFQVNIQDFTSYSPLLQDFLRTMHCKDPPILIDQPNKCPWMEGERQPFLLFALKSSPQNFEQRQAVRETWGQEGTHDSGLEVRTVFLLGTFPAGVPDLQELVRFEALHYGDILQWDFTDSFYNLTLKENAFLGWAQQRCPSVSFIFKGDDDVFVNQGAMLDFLRSLTPEETKSLYTGQVVTDASPIRQSKSKYYIPRSFYDGPYPPYAGGGGYLFSGSLVSPLLQVSKHIVHYPIDDVYTGMCFQALNISPILHSGFMTFDIKVNDRKNVCVHKNLLLVHQRSPQEILWLWRQMHSPLLTC
ncbi:hypothetical protein COCON_G00074190 [Conger conger]|uniref:Hexosyltransferase n=2 Tax=Conger conger TaxID=82655 RepID=A0A9Q1DNB9_CONCO|nr:hypothetical protein COCON_G00074190 [Conger conger]